LCLNPYIGAGVGTNKSHSDNH